MKNLLRICNLSICFVVYWMKIGSFLSLIRLQTFWVHGRTYLLAEVDVENIDASCSSTDRLSWMSSRDLGEGLCAA